MAGARSDDVVWVDILPSLDRMLPALRSGMARIAPQAGAEAGRAYSDGFTRSAVSGVEAASAKLAAARNKEADAAGKLRIAEAKLQELRDSGRARASQLASAEENLARAQRGVADTMSATERATHQLTQAQQQQGRSAQEAEKGNSLLGGSLKSMAGLLIGGGIVAGLKSLYDQAAESQRIGRLTTQVIASTGGAAKISAGQVGDLATAISNKTGVDDEAIQSGENLLLTFTSVRNEVGRGNDIFNQATGVINDMSAALGQDMKSSAIQVGKALNDPIKGVTALQRVGVSFTASQKDQIAVLVKTGDTLGAQKIILGELTKEFGGAAAAASTPLDKLKVTLGNLAEEAGSYVIPIVDKFANFLLQKVIPGAQGAASWVGDHLGPVIHTAGSIIEGTATALGHLAGWFSDLPGPIQTTVLVLGALVLLRGPISAVWTSVGNGAVNAALRASSAAGVVMESGTVMGAAGAVAKAGWSGFMTLLGGPLGLVILGVTTAIALLSSNEHDNAKAADDAAAAHSELASALNASKGAIDANVRAAAAKEAQDKGILDAAKAAGVQLPQVTDAILGQGNAFNEVVGAMHQYVDTHTFIDGTRTKDAAQVQAAIVALTGLAGATDNNITKAQLLGQATAQSGQQMAGPAAAGAQQLNAQLKDMQQAASDAKSQTDMLKLSLDILTGAHVSMIQVESAFDAAVASAKDAVQKEGGAVLDASGALQLHSENGRRVQDVLIGMRDQANTWISTMIQQGATTQEATAKDAELRQSFYTTALQMTGSKDAAQRLTDQIYGIPAERQTQITADTNQATQAVQTLQERIDAIHGKDVTIKVLADASGPGGISGPAAYLVPGSGSGGWWSGGYTGPGGKYDYAGPAHKGEVIWSQDDVAAHGGPQRVDAMRRARGYADGGIVAPITVNFDTSVADGVVARTKQALLEPATRAFAALNWARTQVGKPYVWGGVGPFGYDCSGFMSAITNVIRGRSPYSRVGSTANFPWAGFAPGNGWFTIGSTQDAGGGIGHMAGTLLGVGVESTGDHVRVGGDARTASNGLFGTRDHLLFDQGGLWPPGWGFNGTGDVERVMTPPQDDYFRRFVDLTGADGGAARQVQYVTQVSTPFDAARIAAAVQESQRISEFLHG